MLQTLLDKFIEANRIDEEGAVDSINSLNGNACIGEDDAVDSVTRDGGLVLGLEDYSWNIEMLSIL